MIFRDTKKILVMLFLIRRIITKKETAKDGEKLRESLQSLGGAFIKLGQFMSLRKDFFSTNVRKELELLQDNGKEEDMQTMLTILENEWGQPVHEVLKDIDSTPIGTASIGQVYRGILHSNEIVAIKIKKPNIDREIVRDIKRLKVMTAWVERLTKPSSSFSFTKILEDFSESLLKELDFRQEASYADMFAAQNQSSTIQVPRVYHNFSTTHVLVMEYMKGEKIADFPHLSTDIKQQLAMEFARDLFHQIFISGYFHGDPHPGNILVHKGNLVYLDFGNMGHLYAPTRLWMNKILFSLMNEDFDRLSDVVSEEILLEPAEKRKLTLDLAIFSEKYVKSQVQKINLGSVFLDLMTLLKQYSIYVPPEMIQVGNVLAKAEGTITLLHPKLTLADMIHSLGKQMMKEKYGFASLSKKQSVNQDEIYQMLTELPVHLHRIVKNLSMGSTPVTVRVQTEKTLLKKIDRMMNLFTFGLILLSFSIISTGIILSLKLTNSTLLSGDHAVLLGLTSSLIVTLVFVGMMISYVGKHR